MYDDDFCEEYAQQDRMKLRQRDAWYRHPDPRDPDYFGEPEEDEEEDA